MMKFFSNKKAAVGLSINAIVVIVIAFVVLGLGLTLTRTIFKAAESKVPEAISLTDLESKPTSENPLTLQNQIEIKRNSEKTLNIGYYNKDIQSHNDVSVEILDCVSGAGHSGNLTPELLGIDQDVGPSESKAYKVILQENGLPSGRYICEVAAVEFNEEGTEYQKLEAKQFTLIVTT